jgi:23S rRNA pseudouridine1911/1915/1917 synthase
MVHGKLAEKSGTIDLPIRRKPDSIIERIVTPEGQQAITHYETVWYRKQMTMVQITLETGRTHQIRVHFSSIGHPLVGDDLYGGTRKCMMRQALHCAKLEFIHPFTGEEVSFHAPMPCDMHTIAKRIPR